MVQRPDGFSHANQIRQEETDVENAEPEAEQGDPNASSSMNANNQHATVYRVPAGRQQPILLEPSRRVILRPVNPYQTFRMPLKPEQNPALFI